MALDTTGRGTGNSSIYRVVQCAFEYSPGVSRCLVLPRFLLVSHCTLLAETLFDMSNRVRRREVEITWVDPTPARDKYRSDAGSLNSVARVPASNLSIKAGMKFFLTGKISFFFFEPSFITWCPRSHINWRRATEWENRTRTG